MAGKCHPFSVARGRPGAAEAPRRSAMLAGAASALLAVLGLALPAPAAQAATFGGTTPESAILLPVSPPGSFDADNTRSSSRGNFSTAQGTWPFWNNVTWFSYTPSQTQMVSIRATSRSPAGWDNTLEVWTADGAFVTQRDDAYGLDALVSARLEAGISYRIGLGASSSGRGTATLSFGTSSPEAPTGVTATAADGSAVVSWSAPLDNGSPLTNYTIYCSADGGPAIPCGSTVGAPPARSRTIGNLRTA